MATITLAVTGSISAYKAADLTSQLTKRGHRVVVLMTEAATAFITPLTLQALSKNTVYLDLMVEEKADRIQHISIAKETDLFLLAPLSANTLAKLAHGMADNIVTATALALPLDTPKLMAPAMNTQMYFNPITQQNLRSLSQVGFHEIHPRETILACGDFGTGALADLDTILDKIEETLHDQN